MCGKSSKKFWLFACFFVTLPTLSKQSIMKYDIKKIRDDFPILSREVYGRPLVYLDNAATTQKPLCVLDAMREEYLNVNANVHRGVHYLSQQTCTRQPVNGYASLSMPKRRKRLFSPEAQRKPSTSWPHRSVKAR